MYTMGRLPLKKNTHTHTHNQTKVALDCNHKQCKFEDILRVYKNTQELNKQS